MAARTEYYSRALLTAQPGRSTVVWEFPNLEPEEPVTLRFKARQMGSPEVMGRLVVVEEIKRTDEEGNVLDVGYRPVRDEQGRIRAIYSPLTGWPGGTYVEERLPAGSVREDGWLFVRFEPRHMRGTPGGSVQFEVIEGGMNPQPAVEALQPQGTFVGNYYRSLLIILCHVGVLAAFGVLAGAVFSFPVAALVVTVLFLGGLMVPWFSTNFIEPDQYVRVTAAEAVFDQLWRAFARIIIWPLPNFGEYSPMDSLVNGRMIGWEQVSMAGGLMLVLKGGLALVIAAYFYTRRELARIVV
jgi:hypothetical protein